MTEANQKLRSPNEEISWFIAATFAGLGAGFIAFWLTLSLVYSEGLCAIGVLVVWPFAKTMGRTGFANRATFIYLAATVIGIGVGFASSLGTGVPVTGV
ncbi:MAG: hypothetical protein ACREBS_05885 [Nitrososphaerales archaeon]